MLVIHPFVEIADLVVDGVLSPIAAAARGGARLAQQWSGFAVGQIQAWIEVIFGRIAVEHDGWVRLAKDVAHTVLVAVAVRKLGRVLTLTRGRPFGGRAQA